MHQELHSTYYHAFQLGNWEKTQKTTIQDVDFNGIVMEFTICWIMDGKTLKQTITSIEIVDFA